MKKVGMLFCSFLMFIMWVVPNMGQAASSTMSLVVNGNVVKTDVPPQIIREHTMVPISFAGKAYGVNVSWEANTKSVIVDNGSDKRIVMWPGKDKAYLNGKIFTLDQAPVAVNGRILFPLRQVGEILGATVGWENDTKTVSVNQPKTISINGKALTSTPIYQLPAGNFLSINDVAKPLGYDVKEWAGKVILEQGPEKYTVSKATGSLEDNGYRTIGEQNVISPEFLSRIINANYSWNENKTQCTLDKIQHVSGITLSENEVSIQTEGKMSLTHFLLDNPAPTRIVLDFNHARLGNGIDENLTSSKVKSIRFSQYSTSPDRVRVVIELVNRMSYEVNSTEGETKITLKESQVAPVPAPIPAPSPQPDKAGKYLIVLDAGHGGKDTGAIGTIGNYEKNITLAVTTKLEAILKKNSNFKIVMTRSGDTYPTLQDRVNLANSLNANLFMSIHINSATPTAHGTESYYNTARSKEYATIIHDHLIEATGFYDRGLRTANFYVIKNTKMPSTLVELGFITNSNENKQMLDPAFQQRVAEGLAAGITEYYNKTR